MNNKKTIVVLIGNSDDKLSQPMWASFCERTHHVLMEASDEIHFSGGSSFSAPWQNACWVVNVSIGDIPALLVDLDAIRLTFNQDSIAIIVGKTEFVT